MQLSCPVCRAKVSSFDPMLEHLVTEHGISKRQAKIVTKKLVELRQGGLGPVHFPQADDSTKRH